METFGVMSTQHETHEPRWHGDEVEDKPGDEAEQAADRAEGNQPVRADAEAERQRTSDVNEQPARPRRKAPVSADDEGGIADTAEEHQARRDAGERPPRGKL